MSEPSCLHVGKRYVACDDESEATPLSKGQAYKNDIRVKRQRITVAQDSSADIRFYIAVKEEWKL
jgi:hypothetical protein